MIERVLVIEDDPHSTQDFCALLRRAGFDVTVARRGREDGALADREPFDVILAHVMVPAAPLPVAADPRVARALEEIDRRYAESRLTLTSVARSLGLSPSRLTALIKAATGRTFGVRLHARRVEETARLLLTTPTPIKEIAWRVGYGRTSELDRHFRRRFQVRPSEYRASIRRLHR
ncbi:MAG TPA: helix-turn-helix domain-containing protein [Vicinamibacterales bacterium]